MTRLDIIKEIATRISVQNDSEVSRVVVARHDLRKLFTWVTTEKLHTKVVFYYLPQDPGVFTLTSSRDPNLDMPRVQFPVSDKFIADLIAAIEDNFPV